MNYKKKYEEANDKVAARFGTNVAKEIFTDLYESEDERIVDAIRKALESKIEDLGNGVTKTTCLAWLEKQKTIDVLDEEEREFADNVDSYRKDMDEFYKKGYNAGREAEKQYWLEKQGEQKPTDKIEPKFKVGYRITKSSKKSCPVHSSTDDTICEVAEIHDTCYILNTKEGRIQVPFEWQDHYELVMPTWSEEDEKEYKYVLKFVDNILNNCGNKKDYEHCKRCYDWLKSLKDKIKKETV